ncbi:MAG: tetratricopeptide repeat protein [Cyanobacteria bacterium J06621_11]
MPASSSKLSIKSYHLHLNRPLNPMRIKQKFAIAALSTFVLLPSVHKIEKSAHAQTSQQETAQLKDQSQDPSQNQSAVDQAFALYEEATALYNEGTRESIQVAAEKIEIALTTAEDIADEGTQLTAKFVISTQAGLIQAALGEHSAALEYYQQSLEVALASDDFSQVAIAQSNIATTQLTMGDPDAAIGSYRQALVIARDNGNRAGEAAMLSNIGGVYDETGDRTQALDYYQQSLAISQDIGDKTNEATALDNIGNVFNQQGKRTEAREHYDQALALRQEISDREGEGVSLNNIGTLYSAFGDDTAALNYFQPGLSIREEIGDIAGTAVTLNNIGSAYQSLGETSLAIDNFKQALSIYQEMGDRAGESTTFNNLGEIYRNLGELDQALDYLNQALTISKDIQDRAGEAATLSNIAGLQSAQGENKAALTSYQQALAISKETGDLPVQAALLTNIGLNYHKQEAYQTALGYYIQALPISQETGDREIEAAILNNFGFAYSSLGELDSALDYYQQSLTLAEKIGDRDSIVNAKGNIASVYKQQGDLEAALSEVEDAIALIEDLRTDISPGDLRASYFSTVQGYYQLRTELLMQLGRPEAAFENSEAARARQLIELLSEANVDLAADVSPDLTSTFAQLEQSLKDIEAERAAVQNGDEAALTALETASNQILQQLEQTLSEIREKSPAYATLKQPTPLSLSEIQQTVLDDETVLLQYAIGSENSYLWIVSPTQFQAYKLSSTEEIEPVAEKFLSAITTDTRTRKVNQLGAELTAQILPTLPSWAAEKRLVIAADGILNQIPFGALPTPNQRSYTPLLVEHEVLAEPSMSAIAVLRQQLANRPERDPSVAILADPVYRADDERVEGNPSSSSLPDINQGNLLKSNLRDLDLSNIARLPYTRSESEQIEAIATSIKTTTAYDFEATYDWITRPEISQYSIVHLATHGFVNPTNPHLSGVVLGLVAPDGTPRDNGFLRLHDIFNLNLNAELVVLSACQTGLGQNLSGEGVIGLSRGFMYAGAERVMVSLWNVSDESTAQLMGAFYQEMIGENVSPSEALRATQRAQWEAGERPNRWAAFTLQGEWQSEE